MRFLIPTLTSYRFFAYVYTVIVTLRGAYVFYIMLLCYYVIMLRFISMQCCYMGYFYNYVLFCCFRFVISFPLNHTINNSFIISLSKHIYIHIYIYIYVCTYIHTYTYKYNYEYTYTHRFTLRGAALEAPPPGADPLERQGGGALARVRQLIMGIFRGPLLGAPSL